MTLLREDVEQHWPVGVDPLDRSERLFEFMDVVTIDRPEVLGAELLPEAGGDEQFAHRVLDALGGVPGLLTERQVLDNRAHFALCIAVERVDTQLVHVPRKAADVWADRHGVVVEDDDEAPLVQLARMVHGFQRHARGHRAIANNGDRPEVVPVEVARHGHAQRRRDRRAGVARAERVVRALLAVGEPGKPLELADRVHPFFAAGENLVDVHLVAHVPEDLVGRRIEHAVERDGELHHAEVRGKVAAATDAFHRVHQEIADFAGQPL